MCGAPPSNAQAPAWQEMRVLLAYSLRSDRSNWPSLLQSICAISPGVPSAHMAQPAALPGQTGRLQPAQGSTAATSGSARRPGGRPHGAQSPPDGGSSGAAAGAASGAQCVAAPWPSPLTSLDQSFSETAEHPFSSLFEKIAATAKVRRH